MNSYITLTPPLLSEDLKKITYTFALALHIAIVIFICLSYIFVAFISIVTLAS